MLSPTVSSTGNTASGSLIPGVAWKGGSPTGKARSTQRSWSLGIGWPSLCLTAVSGCASTRLPYPVASSSCRSTPWTHPRTSPISWQTVAQACCSWTGPSSGKPWRPTESPCRTLSGWSAWPRQDERKPKTACSGRSATGFPSMRHPCRSECTTKTPWPLWSIPPAPPESRKVSCSATGTYSGTQRR